MGNRLNGFWFLRRGNTALKRDENENGRQSRLWQRKGSLCSGSELRYADDSVMNQLTVDMREELLATLKILVTDLGANFLGINRE